MADKESIIEVVNLLPLSRLSDDWTKAVWESDFTEVVLDDEVLLDIEGDRLLDILDKLADELNQWTNQQTDEGLWTILVENENSLKALIAFLCSLLLTGHKLSASLSEKQVGIASARVYSRLVLVPGSSAFKVFHPELYEKSVDLLKQFAKIGSTGNSKRKRSITPVKSSQAKKKSKSRQRRKLTDSLFDGSASLDDIDEDVEEDLAPQQINTLRRQLHSLLVDIVTLLEGFSLRQTMSSAYHTVQILAQLTRKDGEMFDGNFQNSIRLEKQSVPALAFKGLQFLCSQQHGHVGSLMNSTCKSLLPSLLMLIDDKSVQTINKALQQTSEHAISFICHLMKQCGERGLPSVRTLLQYMCTKVTDRAEYRAKVAAAVVTLAHELPAESYSKMVQWFYKLSKHSQINNRGFAIEIVSALLATPEKQVTGDIPAELLPYTTHRSLLGILLDRCSDRAPTVRARAIACFGQCLTSRDENIAGTVREIVTPQVAARPPNAPRLIKTPGAHLGAGKNVADDDTDSRTEMTIDQQTIEGSTIAMEKTDGQTKDGQTPLHRVQLTPGFNPNLTDSEGVFSMLRRRAKDEKVNVRKAALQAIESAVRFEAPNYTKQNVELLRDHCRDPGLSVRKQSMQSLNDLLMAMPQDAFLQSNWLLGVLPLVIDRESTLSEKCMETLEELILRNIVPYPRSKSGSHILAWSMLDIIAKPHNVDQRRYLQKACHHWSRQGQIKPALINSLETHIGTDHNAGAWMLLAEIAPAAPKMNHAFLLTYWESGINKDCSSEVMERVLTVVKCVAKHLPSKERAKLIEDLKTRLMKFDSPSELISGSVRTLAKLCNVQAAETGNTSIKLDWCKELLTACDKYLSKVVLEEEASTHNEDIIVCHLFTLGEVVQLCPGKVPKRVFLLVQSMIATPCIASLPASQSQPASQNEDSSPTQSLGSSHDKSGDQLSSSQMSQGSVDSQGTQSSQSSQPLSQFKGSIMSSRVRAFAFITLGKLCLQNEDLAKKCIAALARELETSTDPAIRNNVMIIMCDLCVRYTTTANHYITNIASCLKDPSPLVRKQTLTLITRLLQEDFLKWKGALFYRLIYVLLDDCEEISQFGDFCLKHMLIQRHPTMFFQHFMECVFHFNDYKEHSVYNKFSQSDKDRELFSLKGEKNRKKRMLLYKFMLEQMSDDHKFQMQGKLCQEILGGLVDDVLPINKDTSDLLKDALAILSSKEIKLSSLKVRPNEEVATDEQEMAAVVAATAKKTIITQVVKKNVIENIVPVVVALKHMMEKQRSPLLKELLMYLRELMKDYKNEVKEILSADRQLATEIEFDLRKFEEQQEEARRVVIPPSAQGTPAPDVGRRSPASAPNIQSPNRSALGSPRILGSPRSPAMDGQGGRPHTVGSPKTPALKANIGAGTPKNGPQSPLAPVMKLVTLSGATPSRQAPLSTIAVLNSARQLMDKPAGVASPRVLTPLLETENLENSKSPGGRLSSRSSVDISDESEEMTVEGGKTPRSGVRVHRKLNRAISTPSAAMSNITFHGDGNMTFLPPSPIAEMHSVQRVYDDSNTSDVITPVKGNKNKKTTETDTDEDQVLLIKSPLVQLSKPRVWNVTSPAPQKSKSRVQINSEEESPIPLAPINGPGDTDINQSKRKSRSTDKSKTSLPKEDRPIAEPIRKGRRKRKS